MKHNDLYFSVSSDEELMTAVCSGSTPAFEELYRRYARRLLGYFVRMLNFNTAVAEDALQDLFMKIAERPEQFDANRSFKTWIFTLASNTCKNHYRHATVKKKSWDELNYLGRISAIALPVDRLDGLEFRRLLEQTLDTLPTEKKEAFLLRYLEDKTIAEIAAIQNCPEGSVKSRLHYTIKLLEEKLKIFNPVLS